MDANMTERPWMQTVSGRAFPLNDPDPGEVHWPDVAYHLAHINRFGGAAGGYSVAQHCSWPVEELPRDWQPYWLLHDAHEFATNDLITPMQRALAGAADLEFGEGGLIVKAAIRRLKHGIDSAIYRAAGLTWPVPQEIEDAIHVVDARMIVTEKRDLHREAPMPWGYEHVAPYAEPIWKWSAETAYAYYADDMERLLGLTLPEMSAIGRVA